MAVLSPHPFKEMSNGCECCLENVFSMAIPSGFSRFRICITINLFEVRRRGEKDPSSRRLESDRDSIRPYWWSRRYPYETYGTGARLKMQMMKNENGDRNEEYDANIPIPL
ncbi:hypothetical protein Tco_1052055 [Tanacetum coccineum]